MTSKPEARSRRAAASTKAVPVLWLPYLLYKRAWRELGWTLAFLALLNVALPVLVFGPTFTAVRVAVFGTVLLGIAMTDLQTYLIPDGFTLFGLGWTLLTAILAFFFGQSSLFAAPYEALVGACAGAGMIAIVGWLGEVALKRGVIEQRAGGAAGRALKSGKVPRPVSVCQAVGATRRELQESPPESVVSGGLNMYRLAVCITREAAP